MAAQPKPYDVDHIVIGVSDVAAGAAEFERLTGVKPVYGGRHPKALGTQNALVSLGEGRYLELLAPQPGSSVDMAQMLSALPRPTPIMWAVRYDQSDDLKARLNGAGVHLEPITPGERATPSGVVLHWSAGGLSPDVVGAPFFIHWSSPADHPSQTSPPGCRLVSLAIATPQAAILQRLTAALDVGVEVAQADQLGIRVALDCPNGRVTFPG
jgi:hypothetical protein